MSNRLNNNSADTSMGTMFISPTIINNNYATATTGSGDDGTGDASFPSGLETFALNYSLYSK